MRIAVGLLAFWIIIDKLKIDFFVAYQNFSSLINYELILITFFLLFLNWGLEAYKWKYLIRKTENVSFIKAFQLTVTGITIGIITPNRIGEIPGRAFLMNKKDKLKDLIVKTAVGAYSQLIITFVFGTIASFFVLDIIKLSFNSGYVIMLLVAITLIFLCIYFFISYVKELLYKIPLIRDKNILDAIEGYSAYELLYTLILSVLRYFVFSVQYYFVLIAFDVRFDSLQELLLIPFCFLISSIIPTLLISEIGVRGSVALFVFGVLSNNHLAIVSASILLWLINVATPALIGIFFLKKLKIVSK